MLKTHWISRKTPRLYLLSFLVAIDIVIGFTRKALCAEGSSGLVVSPAVFYREEYRSRNEQSSFNLTLLDLRIGYLFPSGLFLAALADWERENVQADNYPTTGVSSYFQYTRTQGGLSVGYVRSDYYALLSLLAGGVWDLNNGAEHIIYDNGLGAQLDLGVNFKIGDLTYIGPRITLRGMQYYRLRNSDGESSLTPPLSRATLEPYFVLWFEL